MTATSNIIRSVLRNDSKYNILCLCFDGLFEHLLAQTQNEIYVILPSEQQSWISKSLPVPPNLHFYNDIRNIPPYVNFDALICNDRIKLHAQAQAFSRTLHIPLIYIDHFDLSSFKKEDLFLINNNRGHIHICASNLFSQVAQFEYDDLINYGVPLYDISKEQPNDLIIVGDYPQQQLLIHALQNKFKTVFINQQNHPDSFQELIKVISQSKIFVSLHAEAYIPILMLHAMAAGCIPIVNVKNMTSKVINHGYNGIIVQNPQDMFHSLQNVLTLPQALAQMQRAANDTIKIQFNAAHFITQWNAVFSKLSNMVYIG